MCAVSGAIRNNSTTTTGGGGVPCGCPSCCLTARPSLPPNVYTGPTGVGGGAGWMNQHWSPPAGATASSAGFNYAPPQQQQQQQQQQPTYQMAAFHNIDQQPQQQQQPQTVINRRRKRSPEAIPSSGGGGTSDKMQRLYSTAQWMPNPSSIQAAAEAAFVAAAAAAAAAASHRYVTSSPAAWMHASAQPLKFHCWKRKTESPFPYPHFFFFCLGAPLPVNRHMEFAMSQFFTRRKTYIFFSFKYQRLITVLVGFSFNVMLIPYLFFSKKKIAIQTQTSIPLKTPPLPFNRTRTWFFFIARIPASIDGFWKNVCVPSSSIPARKQKESSVIEINYNLIWKQQQKEKSSIFYFQIVVVVEGTTIADWWKNSFFFSLSFSIPFWRWISFKTKKN